MADPLSIVGGVIGILSALTSLSTKINEFRQDVQGAKSEIRELAHEADDLALVLGHLKVAKEQGIIAYSLEHDLGTVLKRLGDTVGETEAFLQRCVDKKRTAGVYWAFSGKSQCLQLCRRLESYKSTINVTLTLSSVLQGHDNNVQGDRVLNSINRIRRQLSCGRDDYVLQRYLMDIETVYEGSTVAGANVLSRTSSLSDVQTDTRRSTEQAIAIQGDPTPMNRDVRTQNSPRIENDQIQMSPDQIAKKETAGKQHPKSITSTRGSRTIADEWTQVRPEPSHVHHFDLGSTPYRYGDMKLASRKGQFVACIAADDGSYGILLRGVIGQPASQTFQMLDGRSFDSPLGTGGSVYVKREVLFVRFRDDGALIVALSCRHERLENAQLRLVIWESTNNSVWKAVSPGCCLGDSTGSQAALSIDCRRLACCESYKTVTIYGFEGYKAVRTCKIEGKQVWLCSDVVWSDDSTQLLVTHSLPGEDQIPAISVFNPSTGSCIASVDFATLPFPQASWICLNFFLLPGPEVVVIHSSPTGVYKKFAAEDLQKPASQPTAMRHFIARINLKHKKVTPKRVERDKIQILNNSVFSPDGSCVIAQPVDSKELQEEGAIQSGRTLFLFDTRSGEIMSRIPRWSIGDYFIFDHDGHMICEAEYLPFEKIFKVLFWEPATGV